jgi:hypothetical protein
MPLTHLRRAPLKVFCLVSRTAHQSPEHFIQCHNFTWRTHHVEHRQSLQMARFVANRCHTPT